MEITKTLYVKDRRAWRNWLIRNHKKKKEIWLVYYKKHSGKKRIPYDDAVEEALCYGWIDSTVKKMDSERYVQKFTPRNRCSVWSQTNIERVRKMIKLGRMTETGLAVYDETRKEKRVSRARIVARKLVLPADMRRALRLSDEAWKNFNGFSASQKKIYIWYVIDAKKPETRVRRIARVVGWAHKNVKSTML